LVVVILVAFFMFNKNYLLSDISSGIESMAAASSSKTAVTFTSPKGGEQWQIGKAYNITWSSKGIKKVSINLNKPGSGLSLAVNLSASSGKYSWTIPSSVSTGDNYNIQIVADGKNVYNSKVFSIVAPTAITIPIPENSKCFWQANGNLPECANFYKQDGSHQMACSQFYNPVYDTNGTFYPSACWAEQLGVKAGSYKYGYSDKFINFIQNLWANQTSLASPDYRVPNQDYKVPNPDIEFSYQGSGITGWKSGVFFRSTLWTNPTSYLRLDYNISTDIGPQLSPVLTQNNIMLSAVGTKPKVLLTFVMFDNAYPEQTLVDWTNKYQGYMNDYISKKENISNPIQYQIVPVVITPPANVTRPSSDHLYFSQDEMKAVYDAATQKLGQNNFQIFTLAPVFLNGFGGYYASYNNMEFIEAPLHPSNNYSATDIKTGLDALSAFQSTFLTISHEVLHAVGLSGDHVPIGYGTTFLDYTSEGRNTDPVTGKNINGLNDCDFLGKSPDYFNVSLPENLQIRVGQEPSWLYKTNSNSGPCLAGVDGNVYLKDKNKDGVYEIMYINNLIGKELQRTLGWVDIDGDGKAELVDPNPYGGYSKIVR
ncbi:MAG: GPI anchored serine-threonine rich family protein, partial [Candidatus Parcubacteria bacterium]|nr:GPI anchored serine-threonine rich family protein [Candidatus Parcubacteria bacterium]